MSLKLVAMWLATSYLSCAHVVYPSAIIHSKADMDDKIGSPDLHSMRPSWFVRLHEHSREIANNWAVKRKSLVGCLIRWICFAWDLPRTSVFLESRAYLRLTRTLTLTRCNTPAGNPLSNARPGTLVHLTSICYVTAKRESETLNTENHLSFIICATFAKTHHVEETVGFTASQCIFLSHFMY